MCPRPKGQWIVDLQRPSVWVHGAVHGARLLAGLILGTMHCSQQLDKRAG
jgi:hypothetical protein